MIIEQEGNTRENEAEWASNEEEETEKEKKKVTWSIIELNGTLCHEHRKLYPTKNIVLIFSFRTY